MHKSASYGRIPLSEKECEDLSDNDSVIARFTEKLSRHLPFSPDVIERGLRELLENEVLNISDNALCQKRMIRDASLSERRSSAGQKGMAKRYSQANEISKDEEQPEPPKEKPK